MPEYMATYGDFITLLLVFFVALYKPTARSDDEMRLIMSAFKGSMGMFEGGQTLSKGRLEDMGMTVESLPAQEKGTTLSKAMKIATEIFKPEIKSRKVVVQQDERGITISLVGSDHFAPGSARLTDETRKILTKVGDLLRNLSSFVRIEGHADETPVASGPASERYETNWELASQRSINVLRFLHENEDVDPGKMSAVSYGRYRPVTE
ncbi:MAG: OmpA family protein, partial [Leptospiraceae bacterium]|nr:OmpA family protein [Leptospiraceae bacterium]